MNCVADSMLSKFSAILIYNYYSMQLLTSVSLSKYKEVLQLLTFDCGECTSARSQSNRCIQSKTTWLMFIHPKFVYKQKIFPKFLSFFFSKNTSKYDKLSKISNISIKTILELRTKFGNFGNFGHISDGLRKQYSVRTQCCNLIGSEPLYIPCIVCEFPDGISRRVNRTGPQSTRHVPRWPLTLLI